VFTEGHIGSDQRKYLLDLARGFPPEHPEEVKHLPPHPRNTLFRLLRPEFLQYVRKTSSIPALNADAFLR